MVELISGHLLPRAIHVVAELGVADHIGDAPRSAAALAQAVQVQSDGLDRVLRLLASRGIFTRVGEGYTHNELSRLLRSDHPHSMRAYARMEGTRFFWEAVGDMQHSVTTGEPAAKKLDPRGIFAFLKDHPRDSEIFDAAMEGKAQRDIFAVTEAYDFSAFKAIADIGGGRGHLLKAILERTPNLRGVLFDQPHVVEKVAPSGRLTLHGGDFFGGELPRCDAYVVMEVLHDWNDQECQQILRSIRKAAPSGAKLLVVETVLPDSNTPHFAQVLDLIMLVMTGGRERSKDEYEKMLAQGGFRFTRVIPMHSPCSIVEAVAA